jgi:multidrug resistance efflux pump
MRNDLMQDLADATEFRLTLQARPPRIVHGTLLLLATLLGAALLWSAATQADLVVRAAGRVRPVTSPMRVINGGSGEVFSASVGGRVVSVHFREGEEVHQGDVLIRLDTERLDNEIAKRRRALQTGEDELAELHHLETLLAQQFASTRAKSEAELMQARDEIQQAQDRQAADRRLAELEFKNAEYEEGQSRELAKRGLVSLDTLHKTTARLHEAKEKLDKARLPVEEGRLAVLQRALDLAEREYAMRRQELQTKQGIKQGEVQAIRIELANLELERQQAILRAPIDGIVTTGDVKVGDLLERRKPVVEIAAQQGFRFEAAVPSEEVGHLRVGMPARIKLDAYDYQRYGAVAGTVAFVAPDSGMPAGQHAVTYLVKIQLEGEELGRGEFRGHVKLGMAGQAEIVTGQERLLTLLVKKIRQTISLG